MEDLAKLMEADFEATKATSVERLDQTGLTSVAGLARQIRDKERMKKCLRCSQKSA